MSPIEAFSFGVPVISTNIGGQAEIVKHNYVGFQVSIKNSEKIAENIENLISDKDLYEEFSKNALEYSKKFSITEYSKKINSIIESFF